MPDPVAVWGRSLLGGHWHRAVEACRCPEHMLPCPWLAEAPIEDVDPEGLCSNCLQACQAQP